ncbi:hypothetical protein [Nostoc sp. CCY0012]|uniref:hypothetical protein n=1 Tax=Nostoc sp. CCY0012 TaxID=1056123 RepID=UPI0039C6CDF4
MTENTLKINLAWSEEHDAFCYQHHICPAAKSLWQWLSRQAQISAEIEPDLAEFNNWVAKVRGKGYSHNYLKHIFNQLVENRVIQVVKQYSWKIFKLLVRPLEWLKPPRKKREKKLHNHVAPQHDTHWVERYWVERAENKYWYYRYCWMDGRKKNRVYIGSVNSPKAREKKSAVESAIADGQTPPEIKKMLRGNKDGGYSPTMPTL